MSLNLVARDVASAVLSHSPMISIKENLPSCAAASTSLDVPAIHRSSFVVLSIPNCSMIGVLLKGVVVGQCLFELIGNPSS